MLKFTIEEAMALSIAIHDFPEDVNQSIHESLMDCVMHAWTKQEELGSAPLGCWISSETIEALGTLDPTETRQLLDRFEIYRIQRRAFGDRDILDAFIAAELVGNEIPPKRNYGEITNNTISVDARAVRFVDTNDPEDNDATVILLQNALQGAEKQLTEVHNILKDTREQLDIAIEQRNNAEEEIQRRNRANL